MCGITGTIGFADQELIKTMCRRLTHRGPDDEGYYVDNDVALGMRRLKVIDLESGKQPIFNEDKSVVIVFNGEIYNYLELRHDLQKRGHQFHSNSDTEAIIHLYEEYGDDCVKLLRGMFGFAIWDMRHKRLLLARDRLGIKPFYYWAKNGRIAFASEMKALLTCPEVSRSLNYEALHHYLTYQYVPGEMTIYQDIHKLPAGHLCVWEKGKIKIQQYWHLDGIVSEQVLEMNEEEISKKMLSLVEDAIRSHLISDVPLGVFLSGGLDSGTIVALASQLTGKKIKTFSIGFDDPRFNELEGAKRVADYYHTDHHEFIVQPCGRQKLEEILATFDEPFADSSAIPTYFVSKYAREHVTVALSGDGGDEVFGGYGNYKADKIAQYYRRIPNIVRLSVSTLLSNIFPKSIGAIQQIIKIGHVSEMSPEKGHAYWLSVFSEEMKKKIYLSSKLKSFLGKDSLDISGEIFSNFQIYDFMNVCMAVDMKTVLVNDYLQKVDRMSMLNSLEVRVPFLDHPLVEFSHRIPSSFKIRGLTTKYILRKMMKNHLPKAVLQGEKMGFSVPLMKWLKDDFSSLLGYYLSKERVSKAGFFDYSSIKILVDEHLSGNRDHGKALWSLICLEIWRQFNKN